MGQQLNCLPQQALFNRADIRNRRGCLATMARYHMSEPVENRYEPEERVLGTGANGEVVLCRKRVSPGAGAGEVFALKRLKKKNQKQLEQVQSEVKVFLQLEHPNIATLVDVFETDSEVQLVMELLSGGEVFERVASGGAYTEERAAHTMMQALDAVNYLHSQRPPIVHRDLKLENFLYQAKDSDRLKLIDFGFSQLFDCETQVSMSKTVGTVLYVAPEVLEKRYTERCDCWSLGVMAYILLTGCPPFDDDMVLRRNWEHLRPFDQKCFRDLSDGARSFVRGLLTKDPKQRLTAAEALKHDWIVNRAQVADVGLSEDTFSGLKSFARASACRKAIYSMMAWSLTTEDREQLAKQFLALDVDRSGTVTLDEFQEALRRNYEINSEECCRLFESIASQPGGGGAIKYTEFLAAMIEDRIRMHEDTIADAFRRFDVQRTGVITEASLKAVLGPRFAGVDTGDLLQEVDRDNTGRVTLEDFMRYMRETPAASPQAEEQPGASRAESDEQLDRRKKMLAAFAALVDTELKKPPGDKALSFGAYEQHQRPMPMVKKNASLSLP